MFEALSDRFDGIFQKLRSKGRLSEEDVDEALREIRLALLEADVNFSVVKDFVARVRADLVGEELSAALNPAQQVIKTVHQELVRTLGGETLRIAYAPKPPTVVLMAGLQGSGKTTNTAKLARWFKAQGRNPLLVGADLQRPAAVEQLRILGEQVGVPVFSEATDPVAVAAGAVAEARRLGRDVVIVDTAGRLAIDEALMAEVRQISEAVQPDYTFLVIDAMTGQDAVSTAEAFHGTLALDGVILTKLDGDARGGAALSVKEVVGRPIAFASTGEKLDEFDLFHPDRLAGRILGMGDMLSLIEKAEEVYEADEAEVAATKLLEGQFTLEDFLEQMQQVRKMGSLNSLMGMMPGIPKEVRNANIDERELARVEGIIHSMTTAERRDPQLIDASRRARIATGAGVQPNDVSALLTQFREMQKMMKKLGGLGSRKMGGGRKGRKGRKGKGGGRTTPAGSGGQGVAAGKGGRAPLALPGLGSQLGSLPEELAGLADLADLEGLGGSGSQPKP